MPKRLPPEVHADRAAWQTEKAESEEARKRRNRAKLAPLLENPPRRGRPPDRLRTRR